MTNDTGAYVGMVRRCIPEDRRAIEAAKQDGPLLGIIYSVEPGAYPQGRHYHMATR